MDGKEITLRFEKRFNLICDIFKSMNYTNAAHLLKANSPVAYRVMRMQYAEDQKDKGRISANDVSRMFRNTGE